MSQGSRISIEGTVPRYAVAPTVSAVPTKRTVLDVGASQAIYEVRIVVNAVDSAAAVDSLQNLLADAFVLGRNEVTELSLSNGAIRVDFVGIGTAKNTAGGVVLSSDNSTDFNSARKTLTFESVDKVRKVIIRTLDPLVAAGTVDPTKVIVFVEGFSDAI